MSEYWVSKKKYYCKYCEIYISDDAPSRNHHEGGMRHKGNLERFIRGIYKTGEKRKKDQDEEKREMARVEQLANAAFAEDVGAGRATAIAGPSAPRRPAPQAKSSDAYANYSTAESLGFVDLDAERLAQELEIRRSQGVAGEWQFVSAVTPAPVPETNGNEAAVKSEDVKPGVVSLGEKRPAEAEPSSADPDDARSFKLRKRTLGTGLGEIYDPGLIPIKVKVKKEDVKQENNDIVPQSNEPSTSTSGPIKWTPLQLPGSTPKASSEERTTAPPTGSGLKWTKVSWGDTAAPPTSYPPEEPTSEQIESQSVKQEAEPESTPSVPEVSAPLFKKRKAPASSARGRRPL